jgi:hypothetical protein
MNVSAGNIRDAFGKVPKPIREFIAEGELNSAAANLAARYQLHVDAAGELHKLMTMVLLGFVTPKALPEELSSHIGVRNDQMSQFIEELNETIFKPLQKKVRESGPEPSKEERIREGEPDVEGAGYRSPPPVPTVQAPQVVVRTVPEQIAPTPATQPAPVPPFNLIRPDALTSALPATQTVSDIHVRTMQHDMQVLKDPSQALHGSFEYTLPSAPHPSQVTPARSFQTASVPYTSTPAYSRPAQPEPLPPPPTAPYTAQPPHSDPYREPI